MCATGPSGELSDSTENGAVPLRAEFLSTLQSNDSGSGSTFGADDQETGSPTPVGKKIATAADRASSGWNGEYSIDGFTGKHTLKPFK